MPRPGASASEALQSLVDRLSMAVRLLESDLEREERQLGERKRDIRVLAELVREGRAALHELAPEELAPPQSGRHRLEKSDPDKYERIVEDIRRPGWTDHAIGKRHGVDPKTVKRIRDELGAGKNAGKNSF